MVVVAEEDYNLVVVMVVVAEEGYNLDGIVAMVVVVEGVVHNWGGAVVEVDHSLIVVAAVEVVVRN